MGKRKLKKNLKTWGCNYGCDVSKSICPHIEKSLPQIVNTLSRARLQNNHVLEEQLCNFEERSKVLMGDLMTLGFSYEDCEIILDRYVSNMELDELKEKYHFVSISSLRYYLKNMYPRLERVLRILYPEGDT